MGVKLPPVRTGNSNIFSTLLKASGLPQLASDAAWSVTHPVDRLLGRGRAANQTMMVVGGPNAGLARLLLNKGRGGVVFSGGDLTFQRMANVAKAGKARSTFVPAEQSAGHSPWIDPESQGRMAVLVHPNGERVLVGQPGLHHHDVAAGAGLRDYSGWAQAEIQSAVPDMQIPPRLFTDNGIGPAQLNPRQYAAMSRFLKNVKGARYGPLHK